MDGCLGQQPGVGHREAHALKSGPGPSALPAPLANFYGKDTIYPSPPSMEDRAEAA